MATDAQGWDHECDVLVVGSGGGALTGALAAATCGLDTLVIEKTEVLGGTTAYSGGGMWLPNNHVELRDVPDTPEVARRYFDGTVGDRTPRRQQDAFLRTAPLLVAELEQNPHLEFEWRPFPDYFDVEGSFPLGRSIYALDLETARLGEAADHLRAPLGPEQGGFPAPEDVLTGGRALLGRLLLALADAGARILRDTGLVAFVVEDGAVVGVEAASGDATVRIRARRGVLCAAGGFERNQEMRAKYQAPLGADWTLGAPGNTGDPLRAGMAIGAATDLLEESWWSPGFALPNGMATFLLLERGLPGGIIVNQQGVRFANESLPYDRLGRAILEAHESGVSHIPTWFIADQRFLDRFGIAGVFPGQDIPAEFFSTGSMHTSDTLRGLAESVGIDPEALVQTVEDFNGYVATGVDAAFHRGEEPFDRFSTEMLGGALGLDPSADADGPNPTLGTLSKPPYYAVKVVPADLGTKGGLLCDDQARVLREDGTPIPGLYAAGNTMASVTGHCYPGPGSPIGTCMVFSYLAVLHMAHELAA